MTGSINKYSKLLRTKHYLKNLLVFVPLFFNQSLLSERFLPVFVSFVAFSMMSSFVYIINDIKDLEQDRQHPTKCTRPIASGQVSVTSAKVAATVCLVLSLSLSHLVYHFSDKEIGIAP